MKLLSVLLFPLLLVSGTRLGITKINDPSCPSGYHIAGTYDKSRDAPFCAPILDSTRCDTCKLVIQAAAEVIEPECAIAAKVLTPDLCNFLCS